MLLGTGYLLCVISQQALVANTSQQGQFDAGFDRYTFAASLGQAIGPGLIIAFGGGQQIPDTGAIFAASVIICIVLTILSFGLGQRRSSNRATRAKVVGSMRTLFRLPGLTRALITSCVILAAVDISLVYLPALGAEHQLSASLIGLLLALRGGASMMSRLRSRATSHHGLARRSVTLRPQGQIHVTATRRQPYGPTRHPQRCGPRRGRPRLRQRPLGHRCRPCGRGRIGPPHHPEPVQPATTTTRLRRTP